MSHNQYKYLQVIWKYSLLQIEAIFIYQLAELQTLGAGPLFAADSKSASVTLDLLTFVCLDQPLSGPWNTAFLSVVAGETGGCTSMCAAQDIKLPLPLRDTSNERRVTKGSKDHWGKTWNSF